MPLHSALSRAVTTITRTITVAAGVLAPGHLGELTAIVPFELVDAALEETRAAGRRVRDLPNRVGVYFLLVMCLFPDVGYLRVWAKMTAGLAGLPMASPTGKALRPWMRSVPNPARRPSSWPTSCAATSTGVAGQPAADRYPPGTPHDSVQGAGGDLRPWSRPCPA